MKVFKSYFKTFIISIVSILILINIGMFEFAINAYHNEYFNSEKEHIETKITSWVNSEVVKLITVKSIIENVSEKELFIDKNQNKLLKIQKTETTSVAYIGRKNGEFYTGGDWVPPEEYDPTIRSWYKKAISMNSSFVSSLYIDAETGNNMVTFSVPIIVDEEFTGVLAIDIFLVGLKNELDGYISNRKDLNIVIVDNNDIVIYYSNEFGEIGKKYNGYEMKNKIPKTDWYMILNTQNRHITFEFKAAIYGNILLNGLFLIGFILLVLKYDEGNKKINILNIELGKKVNELSSSKNEIIRKNNLLIDRVNTDYLTKAYNKFYIYNYIDRVWKKAIKEQVSISIAMIDIDDFKKYNDFYGHLEGDKALKKVAVIIEKIISISNKFARFGGEEFIIITYDSDINEIYELSERIRVNVFNNSIIHEKSKNGSLTLSIGVSSVIPDKEITYEMLIKKADIALYKAKNLGKNKVIK